MQYRRNRTDSGSRRREDEVAEGVRCSCGPRSKNCCFDSSNVRGIFDPRGAWWMSAVNLMVLACSEALL